MMGEKLKYSHQPEQTPQNLNLDLSFMDRVRLSVGIMRNEIPPEWYDGIKLQQEGVSSLQAECGRQIAVGELGNLTEDNIADLAKINPKRLEELIKSASTVFLTLTTKNNEAWNNYKQTEERIKAIEQKIAEVTKVSKLADLLAEEQSLKNELEENLKAWFQTKDAREVLHSKIELAKQQLNHQRSLERQFF